MVIFCILCLILFVGIICVAFSKKFPIIGVIFIVLLVVFFYKSCEQYNEDFPDEATQEERSRKEMDRFKQSVDEEGKYYRQKWEREHPEEAKREREQERRIRERGY